RAPRLRAVEPPRPRPPPASQRTKRGQAWLAITLPDITLAAVLDDLSSDEQRARETQPFVVLDDDRRRRVIACNEAAEHYGIRSGHSMNAAIALCSTTLFSARDVDAEQALLNRLATECLRYTPVVVLAPPDQLLLEVRGSMRLFGGLQS